jgi:CheY-like chemotaxis protein
MMYSILIVDDIPDRYAAVKPELEEKGWEVDVANDRKIAAIKLNERLYTCLWVDIYMPDSENNRKAGIFLIEAIRLGEFSNIPSDIPIIVPTANPSELMGSKLTQVPNIKIVALPAPKEILIGTILNMVNDK